MKKVRDIDWKDAKFIRAGIIPYTIINNIVFFAFALESNLASIADFGGHRESFEKDALDSAIREYAEESLNVFGILNRDIVQDNYVIEGEDTAQILLPISPNNLYNYSISFKNLIKDDIKHEAQNIIWLTKNQLFSIIHLNNTKNTTFILMYYRIHKVIEKNLKLLSTVNLY